MRKKNCDVSASLSPVMGGSSQRSRTKKKSHLTAALHSDLWSGQRDVSAFEVRTRTGFGRLWRPRPLAKNAPRFLDARALHRVRFSAVRSRNKKAGRDTALPALDSWWRCGESNSGPRKLPDRRLQAQSLVWSRTLCAQRHARSVPTGSVLARAIPITCAGAFP